MLPIACVVRQSASVVPALRKGREERGTHSDGGVGQLKGWAARRFLRGKMIRVHPQLPTPKEHPPSFSLPVGNCPMVNLLLPIGRVGSDFSTLVLIPIIAL